NSSSDGLVLRLGGVVLLNRGILNLNWRCRLRRDKLGSKRGRVIRKGLVVGIRGSFSLYRRGGRIGGIAIRRQIRQRRCRGRSLSFLSRIGILIFLRRFIRRMG